MKISKPTTMTFAALTATWLACAPLHGAEGTAPPEPAAFSARSSEQTIPAHGRNHELRLYAGGVPDSTVGDGESAYALILGGVELDFGPARGAFKIMDFSWNRPGDFVVDTRGRDPWGRLHEISLGVKREGRIRERIGYGISFGVASGFEDQWNDSFSFHGGGYGIFEIAPKWTLVAGLLYSRHQKVRTDFDFLPIAGVSWNAETTEGFSFTLGLPATDLTWHFGEGAALALEIGSLESGIHRLADDSPVREKGYVEFSGATAALRFETRIRDRVGLELGLSYDLSREIKLHDRDGKNERKYDVEKNPGFFASMSLPF